MADEQVVAGAPKSASGLGIAGLVLGILALVSSFLPIINVGAMVLAVIGFILALIGLITAGKNNKSKGVPIAAVVINAVAIVVVMATGALYTAAVDTAVNETNANIERATGDATEDILGTEVDVTLGKYKIKSSYGTYSGKLAVTVKNLTDEKTSFVVEIEAVDKKGDRIDTGTIYANDLGAGQSQEFETMPLFSTDKKEATKYKNATFKIVSVSAF